MAHGSRLMARAKTGPGPALGGRAWDAGASGAAAADPAGPQAMSLEPSAMNHLLWTMDQKTNLSPNPHLCPFDFSTAVINDVRAG